MAFHSRAFISRILSQAHRVSLSQALIGQRVVDSANLRHLGKDWDSLISIDLARQERSIFYF
jgi:hypothetical protein